MKEVYQMSNCNAKSKLFALIKGLRIAFFPLMFCYLELVLHFYAYRSFDEKTVWIILFSVGLGFVPAILTQVFPRTVNRVLTYVFAGISILAFEIETVYFSVFKGFAPLSAATLGAQAVTNFTGATLTGIRDAIGWILLLLLPLVAYILYDIFVKPSYKRPEIMRVLAMLLATLLVLGGSVGTLAKFFSGVPSLFNTLTSSDTSTDTGVYTFGLNTTILCELRWLIFPSTEPEPVDELNRVEYDAEYQIDESISFSALYEKAGDDTELKNLTASLSNMPVSKKNEYTGLCEGYNLVAICAEAFSPEFIDPELTPTLYKLINSGFVFNNFYSTFPNTTTNGEYTFCMGLLPDMSRTKIESSFGESTDNYLPYCYGNIFKDNGWTAKAYHNYQAEFYFRNYTHPNMGYEFKAANDGLNMEITWPSSDLEMMEKSCSEYVNSDTPFVAYYMTFSGHYQYTLENAMSAKNWDRVADLDYSDAVKAYIACNLELEDALTYLMEQLEEAGVADKTMIVLTADHFPYGLQDSEYAELAGREINDNFDKLQNAFVCYVPGIEPVQVDSYCSTVDILPTVLNLLGITYDSRLLAGCDVLDAESEHYAILFDGSFITDGIKYDASKVDFTYDEESDDTVGLGSDIYEIVQKKFDISKRILYSNYYSFVFDRDTASTAIVDLTAQYKDMQDIMVQAPVYYVLKNELIDPVKEDEFGFWNPYSYADLALSMYRIAGKPEISVPDDFETPFEYDDEYATAVYWALDNGIIADDGYAPHDLSEQLTIGDSAVILTRFAVFIGRDTTVDAVRSAELAASYPELDYTTLVSLQYCNEHNIITGDGSEGAPFDTPDNKFNRLGAVQLLYKFCTYAQ